MKLEHPSESYAALEYVAAHEYVEAQDPHLPEDVRLWLPYWEEQRAFFWTGAKRQYRSLAPLGVTLLKLHQRNSDQAGQRRATKPGNVGRPKKGTRASTNSLLLDLFNKNPESKSWTSRKLATALSRCRSSVEGTKAYKTAEELRAQTKAELKLRLAGRARK